MSYVLLKFSFPTRLKGNPMTLVYIRKNENQLSVFRHVLHELVNLMILLTLWSARRNFTMYNYNICIKAKVSLRLNIGMLVSLIKRVFIHPIDCLKKIFRLYFSVQFAFSLLSVSLHFQRANGNGMFYLKERILSTWTKDFKI